MKFIKRLLKPKPKGIVLKGVKPSFAIQNAYHIQLNKMVRLMMADIIPVIINEYKNNKEQITEIVGDSLVDDIYHLITIKLGNWAFYFDRLAHPLATKLTSDINNNVNYQFTNSLAPLKEIAPRSLDEFKITLSTDTQRIALAKAAAIRENVNLITNIVPKVQEQIHQAVMASISRGRDVEYIKTELMKIDKMTLRRAALIARDQNNKVTSVLNNAKMADIGITKAIWRHSNGGEVPRPDHVAANGKEYDISKGCLISGGMIYPGQLINCRCYAEAVLPFDLGE